MKNRKRTIKKSSSRNLSWTGYLRLISRLYRKIDWDTEEFDTIVSINRGGNIIGTLLSHKTRIPLEVIKKDQVLRTRGRLLIVDDISDTGATLLQVISNLKSGTSHKTATLHMQPHTNHTPDYYVSKVNRWIIYPYERFKNGGKNNARV